MNTPKICVRCGEDLTDTPHTMSMFNTDTICMYCKRREKNHPQYQEAYDAEVAACKRGDFNFPGLGCPPELYLLK
jgi:hypothetical protein